MVENLICGSTRQNEVIKMKEREISQYPCSSLKEEDKIPFPSWRDSFLSYIRDMDLNLRQKELVEKQTNINKLFSNLYCSIQYILSLFCNKGFLFYFKWTLKYVHVGAVVLRSYSGINLQDSSGESLNNGLVTQYKHLQL
jgi:hypothetical protein